MITTHYPQFRILYKKNRGLSNETTTFENCFIVGGYDSNDGIEGMKIWCPERKDYRNLNHHGIVSVEVMGR